MDHEQWQELYERLQGVLAEDCPICEDMIALSCTDGVWKLQCASGCPPYAEGLTIQRACNAWARTKETRST
jgi:hypothetical protein